MLKVIKATELDGVTLKDANIPELLKEAGVISRTDSVVLNADTIGELSTVLALTLSNTESGEVFTTSSIQAIRSREHTAEVETRNTIYFLERVDM